MTIHSYLLLNKYVFGINTVGSVLVQLFGAVGVVQVLPKCTFG